MVVLGITKHIMQVIQKIDISQHTVNIIQPKLIIQLKLVQKLQHIDIMEQGHLLGIKLVVLNHHLLL